MFVEGPKSFYDWEQRFRTKPPSHNKKKVVEKKKLNSLGIEKSECSRFIKQWEEENLSKS
ncbi:hypothetical protein LCGC14_3118890 [marine sediment metagenome]|uniref:Uncharacterized protein n=1 Tax=marine sediment metagenome TaxID=412755 RepID=A0A0F8WRT4_9ZZZZ